jgi:hypothetical protein
MTGGDSRNILRCGKVSQSGCICLAQVTKGASAATIGDETQAMDSKTSVPLGNVVRFPSQERTHAAPACSTVAEDSWDYGPSPEESLRIMRAFVGIKNRKVRTDLIEMLEGASRTRGQAPGPGKSPSKD